MTACNDEDLEKRVKTAARTAKSKRSPGEAVNLALSFLHQVAVGALKEVKLSPRGGTVEVDADSKTRVDAAVALLNQLGPEARDEEVDDQAVAELAIIDREFERAFNVDVRPSTELPDKVGRLDTGARPIVSEREAVETGEETPSRVMALRLALVVLRAWFYLYQLAWLADTSRYRIYIKSRQIGITELVALEMVLAASGVWPSRLFPFDCVIISKRERDAKKVIRRCKAWVRRLRKIPMLRPFMQADAWSQTEITFAFSGFSIWSETQSENAGRSNTGHLYLDEFAFYAWQHEIWTGARPIVISNPNLRVSIVTTPNGDREMAYQIWTKGKGWSRHYCDVYQAVEQGFPLDVEKEKTEGQYTSDKWAQEFECSFISGGEDYHSAALIDGARGIPPTTETGTLLAVFVGVDAASIVDSTSVVATEVWDVGGQVEKWIRAPWVISDTPYRSGETVRGQAEVVEALLLHHGASEAQVDITGNEAAALYGLLVGMPRVGDMVRGQIISKAYKDHWVPQLKNALETEGTYIAQENARIYSPSRASQYGVGKLAPEQVAEFLAIAFQETQRDVLKDDFRRIHKKWVSPTQSTFDAKRDASGHGDSYFGALFGWEPAERAHPRLRDEGPTSVAGLDFDDRPPSSGPDFSYMDLI